MSGVGRVLVARLVEEGIRLRGSGGLLVRPRPGSDGFYRRLGFRSVGNGLDRLVLPAADAAALLAAVSLE